MEMSRDAETNEKNQIYALVKSYKVAIEKLKENKPLSALEKNIISVAISGVVDNLEASLNETQE